MRHPHRMPRRCLAVALQVPNQNATARRHCRRAQTCRCLFPEGLLLQAPSLPSCCIRDTNVLPCDDALLKATPLGCQTCCAHCGCCLRFQTWCIHLSRSFNVAKAFTCSLNHSNLYMLSFPSEKGTPPAPCPLIPDPRGLQIFIGAWFNRQRVWPQRTLRAHRGAHKLLSPGCSGNIRTRNSARSGRKVI